MNLFDHDLLGTVTKVVRTRDGWVSIYADQKRVARVPRAALETIRVEVGGEWTRPLAAACGLAAEAYRAKRKAAALLKVQARSRAELRERLARAGFSGAAVEAALAELVREGLVDDGALAAVVGERAERKGLSARATGAKLAARGLEGFDRAADTAGTGGGGARAEFDRALEAARNRVARIPESLDGPARARRLVGALARLGYEEDVAREAAQRVLGFQHE